MDSKNNYLKKSFMVMTSMIMLLLLGMIPSSASATGATRYVAPSGSNTGNCASIPCRTLQYAVDQSASGDTILVAEGTYTFDPSVPYYCPTWTSAIICFVNKNLSILGGYSLDDNWATRDYVLNPTILDGQNAHRGVVAIGYNNPNTFYLTMEGFTIQNSLAQGPTGWDTSGIGGGMLVQHAAIILRDMKFLNNRALGQNTTSGDGGHADGAAIRLESAPVGSTSLLQRVVFDGNQSIGGTGPNRGGIAFGALFIYDSTVIVEDATFTNNLAQGGNSPGNGISQIDGLNADALGGAVAVENGYLTLNRIVVTDNQVRGGDSNGIGGGSYGGGIFVEGVPPVISSVSITDAYVAHNTATGGTANKGGNSGGGGILITNTLFTINRAQVILNTSFGGDPLPGGNSGPGGGGGLYLFSVSPGIPTSTLSNMIIADNLAIQGDGDLISGSLGNGGGGGLVVQGMNANISHVTFARNRLDPNHPGLILGQAIGVLPWYLSNGQLPATVNLDHSIVADHTIGAEDATAVIVQLGTTFTFNQVLFSGNTKNTNADGHPVTVGTIIGLNTTQTTATAGFIAGGDPYQNYHLRLDSPAKDQATTSMQTIDYEDQPRPYNGVNDLGGDEYRPFPLVLGPGNQSLALDWSQSSEMLAGGVQNFWITVTCPAGANRPLEGGCGVPFEAGPDTTFRLTGLSNFATYGVLISAHDGAGATYAQSIPASAFPTDLLAYLPLILR